MDAMAATEYNDHNDEKHNEKKIIKIPWKVLLKKKPQEFKMLKIKENSLKKYKEKKEDGTNQKDGIKNEE
jgi:hypothetical protein